MYRRTAAVLAATVLITSGVGIAAAAGPSAIATGAVTYRPFGGTSVRHGSFAAFAGDRVSGMWNWQNRKGPITCLVVDGQEAWLAGPGTTGPDTGVFMHVYDGGSPGVTHDLATAWGQDPGQPFSELLEWCETKADPAPFFELDHGDVTVKSLP